MCKLDIYLAFVGYFPLCSIIHIRFVSLSRLLFAQVIVVSEGSTFLVKLSESIIGFSPVVCRCELHLMVSIIW